MLVRASNPDSTISTGKRLRFPSMFGIVNNNSETVRASSSMSTGKFAKFSIGSRNEFHVTAILIDALNSARANSSIIHGPSKEIQ